MPDNDIMEEMVRRITELENQVRIFSTQKIRFDIFNLPGTFAAITADQNNYDIGNYDLLRIQTDVSRNFSGFANGVEGRRLIIRADGSSANIVFLHNSGLSINGNRIVTYTAANVTISNRQAAYFVYIGNWILLFTT